MAAYRKIILRLSLLGLLVTGGALLTIQPAQATDCQTTCTTQRNSCTASCGQFLTCVKACWNIWAECIKTCG